MICLELNNINILCTGPQDLNFSTMQPDMFGDLELKFLQSVSVKQMLLNCG